MGKMNFPISAAGGVFFRRMRAGLPRAAGCLVIMIQSMNPSVKADNGFVLVESLEELRLHLPSDGVKVRLVPGVYRLDTATSPDFLDFSGNSTHFDFTGVKLEVDTALLQRFREGTNILMLSGNRILLEGLSLETIGGLSPPGGSRAISIKGNDVTVKNVSLRLEGSYPYGYGSYFGIGAGAAVNPQKLNGIRVGGINGQVINCRVIMRSFGHAIFVRGGVNTLIKDCYVEGVLRKTDDILAETSGLAFEQNFTQYTGEPIPAGRMTSLSEDGIRAYGEDPLINRRTRNVRVENCRVVRMRRGICLAFAEGDNHIIGCEVTESERVGFHIGSNTMVRDSRGDALFTQLLDISSTRSRNADVEMEVLDSRKYFGNTLLAKINGTGHRVVLREAQPGVVPAELSIELGTDRGFGAGRMPDTRANRVRLANATPATVILHPTVTGSLVGSAGPVRDLGVENTVFRTDEPEKILTGNR